MRKAAAIVVLLLIIAAAVSSGQSYSFTLEQAIAYGLANSTAIKSRQLALLAAQAEVAAARSARYPSLSAGLSYTHLSQAPPLSGSDPVSLSIEAGQTVYTFGKIKAAVLLAEEAADRAALDLAEERRKTITMIKGAFYGYLLALEVAAINKETLAAKEEALEVARQRFLAGLVADFEVLRAESDLESFKATVISTDNGVRIALLNAKTVLGIEEEDFQFELIGELQPIAVQIDRETLVRRALEGKHDILSFKKGRDILAAQDRLNRSLNKPTLAAWANYTLRSDVDTWSDSIIFDLGEWGSSWQAGLNLNVPISGLLPWSKESAAIRKSEAQLEDMRLQLGALESGVRIAVESSILKIAEERAKIASGRKSVELAQRLYQAAVEQYEGGYISSVELKDAQLGLNGARLAYAQAVYNFNRNALELMDVVGVYEF